MIISKALHNMAPAYMEELSANEMFTSESQELV